MRRPPGAPRPSPAAPQGPLPARVGRWTALVAAAACLSGCAKEAPRRLGSVAFDPDRIPEAYARSTAALMWPAATRAFQITPAGDFYNGAWIVRIRPSVAGPGGDSVASSPHVVAFEERWRPIAHWDRAGGSLRWSFEAIASPVNGDSNLFVSVLVRAENLAGEPRRARLDLTLAAADSDVAWVAWDSGASATDSLPAWTSGSGTRPAAGLLPGARNGALATASWTLPAHAVHEERIVLSAYARPAQVLADYARVPHERRVLEARAWWDAEVRRGTRFALGEPDVEAALDAARVTLLACRERRGGRWFPIGGPLQYRDVWLRDGARAVQALAMVGYTRESRQLAAGLQSLQWPSGAFITQRGQGDGTGQALWAFDQAALRPPSSGDSLEALAGAAIRAWRWCESRRRIMAELRAPRGGLLPYADPRDNELVRAALTGTDAWTLAGYRAAARLAAAAGHPAVAESIEASRREYTSVFMRSLVASHSPDVPASWDGPARDWGNIAALYPCQVGAGSADSAAWDRRARALVHRLLGASETGLLSYGASDSLHTYLGADLGSWALLADERGTFERVLDAMLKWRSASGGWAELFSRSQRDFGRNLPPHASSAAAFAVLVRNAVVFDDGPDMLLLTLGARASWWRGAKVEGAPTRWGVVDLAFARKGDVAEWTWTPVRVQTLLRLPPGTVVADVTPPLAGEPGSDHILAPAGMGHAIVRLRPAAAAPSKQGSVR